MRSPRCLCSDLRVLRTSPDDDPSRCWLSRPTPRPSRTVSSLADARLRGESTPGLTDSLYCVRQRERSRADWYRRLIGCIDAYGGLLPAPARFPRIDVRSRNRSAPHAPAPCRLVIIPRIRGSGQQPVQQPAATQPATINATEPSASTMPVCCSRLTRSRRTTVASNTVAAGYNAPSTLTRASMPP